MSCGNDSGCFNISKKYIDDKNSIDSYGNNIISYINEASSTVSTLDIPNDYLGSRVKEKISEIIDSFSSDLESISSFINNVGGFATEKSKEHLDHYNKWKSEQERIRINNRQNNSNNSGTTTTTNKIVKGVTNELR